MRILSPGRTATITFHLTSARANPEMSVGDHMTSYDSLLILTHFKGHTMGGFGGSNKNIGIVASLDILAADQASVDLVYALPEESRHDLVERMESRHGLRQLSYMKELGMGHDRYTLINIDHDDEAINAKTAVKGIHGTWVSDGN